MSNLTLYGFAQSSYVLSARAACAVKGVPVDFVPIAPPDSKTDAHLARHPYGKVPALIHGDFALYETSAIARYIDAAFDGPALIPSDPKAAAKVEQWISATSAYLYREAVLGYAFAYMFPGTDDGSPNRAQIDAALPKLRHTLGLIADAVADTGWLVGDSLTLADLFAGPLVLLLGRFPEGKALLDAQPNLGRYIGNLTQNAALMSAAPSA